MNNTIHGCAVMTLCSTSQSRLQHDESCPDNEHGRMLDTCSDNSCHSANWITLWLCLLPNNYWSQTGKTLVQRRHVHSKACQVDFRAMKTVQICCKQHLKPLYFERPDSVSIFVFSQRCSECSDLNSLDTCDGPGRGLF